MEEKERFVSLAGSGHFTMTELCEEFGITRKTGHKWVTRYTGSGIKGLEEQSPAPKNMTCRTSREIERLICGERRLHPTWGAKKIHQRLIVKRGVEKPPVISTIGEVLKRLGMVKERMDRWRKEFNEERPHEALRMRLAADVYQPSARRLDERIKPRLYALGVETRRLDAAGFVGLNGGNCYVGESFVITGIVGFSEISFAEFCKVYAVFSFQV